MHWLVELAPLQTIRMVTIPSLYSYPEKGGYMTNLSEKCSVKLGDNASGEQLESPQNREHRLVLSWHPAPKAYCEGWDEIHLFVTLWNAGQYCAIFDRARMNEPSVDHASYRTRRHDGYGLPTSTDDIPKVYTGKSPAVCRCEGYVKMPVLVQIFEFVEQSEPSAIWVPSMKRLIPLDHCLGLGRHPLSLNAEVTLESLGVGMDREAGSVSGDLTIELDQAPSQVVKGRSPIVDSVSKDKSQRRPERSQLALIEEQLLASLWVEITGDVLNIGTLDEFDASLYGIEVTLSTSQFSSCTVQCDHGLYYDHEPEDFKREADNRQGRRNPRLPCSRSSSRTPSTRSRTDPAHCVGLY